MPTPGAHDECGNLIVERVGLAFRAHVFDSSRDRISEIDLSLDNLTPGGGLRVLEISHVGVCGRLEGVDHHLCVAGRTRDFDSSVLKFGRSRPNSPAVLADPMGIGKKIWEYARIYLFLPQSSCMQKLFASSGESTDQPCQKLDPILGEDVAPLNSGRCT